jgi:hypothetical protein
MQFQVSSAEGSKDGRTTFLVFNERMSTTTVLATGSFHAAVSTTTSSLTTTIVAKFEYTTLRRY